MAFRIKHSSSYWFICQVLSFAIHNRRKTDVWEHNGKIGKHRFGFLICFWAIGISENLRSVFYTSQTAIDFHHRNLSEKWERQKNPEAFTQNYEQGYIDKNSISTKAQTSSKFFICIDLLK